MIRLFRRSRMSTAEINQLGRVPGAWQTTQAEWCYMIEAERELSDTDRDKLYWLLGETYDPKGLSPQSFLGDYRCVIEVGPSPNFATPWSSTAQTICLNVGIDGIKRIERSRRYGFVELLNDDSRLKLEDQLHDRMTQVIYHEPPATFEVAATPRAVRLVPVMAEGMTALERANYEFGLAMDDDDLKRYLHLFTTELKRDPTDVELFQLGVGNSEHSRHGFFRGQLTLDGVPIGKSLMRIVKEPWRANPSGSEIAFHDDSSAISGGKVFTHQPARPGAPSKFETAHPTLHPTLTAETHNFPTGIAPYPGAATGTGGRIRDNQAVGRGGHVVASGVGYSVGNLHIPGYDLPWEQDGHVPPTNLAAPLDILIQASNGASDYGNCFGEPLILGHVRTFGQLTPGGYRSWYKPIMYSEGVGMIDARHVQKGQPEVAMKIVQIGGPSYRIGMGGGSASSMMSGQNEAGLDFNAVQRGDPEMEQRLGRVMRACIELGDANPIVSAHDLGAGGDSNALPEIVAPAGGRIHVRELPVADASMSVLEIWGNESQERNALLLRPEDIVRFRRICEREHVPCAIVGEVTGDGQLVLHDALDNSTPVDLPIERILDDSKPKTVELKSEALNLEALAIPEELTATAGLIRVMRLVSVGYKSWLTRKVDGRVTGLIAQQQTIGPVETPLSDYAVVAHSLFGNTGTVLTQGERPLLGLISPAAQGRMSVAEAVTNMMGAGIRGLGSVRASANWMWAAKLEGEGARLYAAAVAMSDLMTQLGMAVDGGKDSLSMAASTSAGVVKAPGQLVIAPYAYMPDVRRRVGANFTKSGSQVVWIDLAGGQTRLGGSALAQTLSQIGNECPDVDSPDELATCFELIQEFVSQRMITALHDVSDGGLAVCLAEMALAGNVGLRALLDPHSQPLARLFAEELGIVIEVPQSSVEYVMNRLEVAGLRHAKIGEVGRGGAHFTLAVGEDAYIDLPLHTLRSHWEKTSSRLDALQADPTCVAEETAQLASPIFNPRWQLSYKPERGSNVGELTSERDRPKVAVLREAGSNGDREMAASLMAAGFEVWDVTMSDLTSRQVSLDEFRGIVFPGGFAYGDVMDAGKGWAGAIRFNEVLRAEFERFRNRPDTFSLGVCNGAQLMLLLGWTSAPDLPEDLRPRFVGNASGRFESRLVTVEILPSPAVMLRGMSGSRLGVWVAHGEGRLHVPDPATSRELATGNLAPIRFAQPVGGITERYPMNPNGSPDGITALCSPDGRHLAMMPHPERLANQLWQWPWLPEEWQELESSPWLRMFQNARDWCVHPRG